MRSGDFDRAWEISDRDLAATRRAGRPKHEGPRHLQRIWRGENLSSRRVLVRCYHGLGDTIQFARFLPPLGAIAGKLTVWCQPQLVSLIGRVENVDLVLPLHDGSPDVDFDVDIEIMEIPHAIRANSDQIRMSKPYLEPASRAGFKLPKSGDLSVGLIWNVGEWDRRRVVPAILLKRLKMAGLQLYSLQRGPASEAATDIAAIDISVPNVEDLADRLIALDLCICPDTMLGHLAAALGRETWILLHADCDWRWPASGRTSLWYPSVRLFHQQRAGSWEEVIGQVRSELATKAGAASAQPDAIEKSKAAGSVADERWTALSRRPR